MIFVNSMSDLFHELVPDSFIDDVFAVMAAAPQHTFQVLTKRPERAREWFESRVSSFDAPARVWALACGDLDEHACSYPFAWPLPNVWLGVSIENARFAWRADVLREISAAVRFISAEPLLGSLFVSDQSRRGERRDAREETRSDTGAWIGPAGVRTPSAAEPGRTAQATPSERRALDLTRIDWLIAGGESGHGARPMRVEWARELRDACEAAGTAFFFKQWGGRTPKAGGRELDGRTWDELPTSEAA